MSILAYCVILCCYAARLPKHWGSLSKKLIDNESNVHKSSYLYSWFYYVFLISILIWKEYGDIALIIHLLNAPDHIKILKLNMFRLEQY